MALIFCLSILLAFSGSTLAENLDKYYGYNKYTVFHDREDAFNYMVDLQMRETDLDFFLLTRNLSVVSVAPVMQRLFETRLSELGVEYDVKPLVELMNAYNETIENHKGCIGSECPLNRSRRQARGFFGRFARYNEILSFMSTLAARHPNYCRYESLGHTYEGRHVAGLSISLNSRLQDRRVAYIQGGVHGREWITPMAVLYLANELLNNLRSFSRLLAGTEIYVVPLVNPDGYEYTHTSDRFWRKNRHYYPGRSCRGVDINRNFASYWNYRGASQNLCSEVYSGTSAGSELETQAVTRYLQHNRHRVKVLLDVHSFGKFLFYPYGYSKQVVPPTRNFLHAVANRAAAQIARYRGTRYTVGTSAGILYEASGSLDDYAYANLGIPLAYTVELPGENFQVASSDIIHVCKETFAGFIEFIRHGNVY